MSGPMAAMAVHQLTAPSLGTAVSGFRKTRVGCRATILLLVSYPFYLHDALFVLGSRIKSRYAGVSQLGWYIQRLCPVRVHKIRLSYLRANSRNNHGTALGEGTTLEKGVAWEKGQPIKKE